MTNDKNIASFLFIPDISGFSNFVDDTEVNHSSHIISELLEIIIQSNQLNLEIAEIEGDAVLFYKKEVPQTHEILEQSKKMFIAFHHHLRKYEVLRICHCGACRTATDLSLKFIAHSGNFSFIDVGGFHKPFGKEVVTAHKLLKNTIPHSEYLLLTNDLIRLRSLPTHNGGQITYKTGEDPLTEIGYTYMPLDRLHKLIPPVEHIELPQKSKNPIRRKGVINRPVKEVYALLMDFDFKQKWNKGISKIEYDKNKTNKIGTTHTCTVQHFDMRFQTITNDFGSGKWVYGEKLLNPPLVKEADFYFILEQIDAAKTLLTFELHYKPMIGPLKLLSFIFRVMFKSMYKTNIAIFRRLAEQKNYAIPSE